MAKTAKTTKSGKKAPKGLTESPLTSTGQSPELKISQPSVEEFEKRQAPDPVLKPGDELPLNEGLPKQEDPPVFADPASAKPKASGKYVVPEGEEDLYHVEIEKKQFSPTTGERLSKPYVQKFNARDYANFEKNAKGLGFTINAVLHTGSLKKRTQLSRRKK